MQVFWWAAFSVAFCFAEATLIRNVPYHRQITDYSCGDASTEMVLHFWATPDVDQRAIIDVLRTTEADGTLSYDVVRAGHFSAASASIMAGIYPEQAPKAGWSKARPLGMAAFSRRGADCWTDDLKTLLAANIPVIVLQYYGPEPDNANGTHYRVVVGYDAPTDAFLLYDPWDRTNSANDDDSPVDRQPRLLSLPTPHMCSLWQYAESNGNAQYGGYFGAVFLPWTVELSYDEDAWGHLTINATVSYPCPPGMTCDGAPNAVNCTASLSLPPALTLLSENSIPTTVALGDMKPGSSITLSWLAQETDSAFPAPDAAPTAIVLTASGTVTAIVPEYAGYYPAYTYTDVIGGSATVPY